MVLLKRKYGRRIGLLALIGALGLSARASARSAKELCAEADALQFRGRLTPAVKLYQQAMRLDPDDLDAYLNASVAYKALGKNALAAALLERAADLAPSNPDIQAELGWLYEHDNDPDKALKAFERALTIDPKHPSAQFGKGVVLLRTGRAHDAIEALRKFGEERPHFAAAHYFLGLAYEQTGDLEPAFNHDLTAVRKDWAFAEARLPLARMYAKLRKYDLAREQYESVLNLDRRNPAARAGLRSLREKYGAETAEIHAAPSGPRFTAVRPIEGAEGSETIRVGLWTSATGLPPRIGGFTLEASSSFTLVGVKTGKSYGGGGAGEPWKVSYLRPGRISVKSPNGREIGPFRGRIRIRPESSSATIVVDELLPWRSRYQASGSKEVRGALEVAVRRNRGLYLVNALSLEEYLAGVVPAEMPSTWPLEAQKAQAVIARNYALLRKHRARPHRRFGYDLCDSQHCQVYRGVRMETDPATKAVEETAGQGLYYGDSLVYSYYHSSCGGHTRSASELPGWGRAPYLTGRFDLPDSELSTSTWKTPWELDLWIKGEPDAYCNLPEFVSSSEFRWLRVVPRDVIERKMNRRFHLGRIRSVTVAARGRSGHASEVVVRGTRRRVTLRHEHLIRYYLGLESLRSALIVVETRKNAAGKPAEFWIYGGGWGHGIGLCQSGAGGMASRDKKDYKEILSFYFPGTKVRRIGER